MHGLKTLICALKFGVLGEFDQLNVQQYKPNPKKGTFLHEPALFEPSSAKICLLV